MGLFSAFISKFKKEPSVPNVPEDVTEDSPEQPLWCSIPSDENREKDKAHTTDYSNVVIYIKNGEIFDVVPDVNNYYLATHYNIDGILYDISDVSSVNKIPVPSANPSADRVFFGTPVYALGYLLRLHAGLERKSGNKELSYALMDKGTKLLKSSGIIWQRHDYLREYYWLLDDDRIEDALAFFKNIEHELPSPYSDKEYTKEIQHYNYAILKRNFPDELPKSFSAYMRNFNKKEAKYEKYKELAKTLNIVLDA